MLKHNLRAGAASLPTGLIVRLAFKRIVAIRPAAHEPENRAARHVCRSHQRSPSLVLANVNHLVIVSNVQRRVGLAQDDVAKLKVEPRGQSYSSLRKLVPLLKIVTNNTPQSVGGGGKPRGPLAPPFGT